jgi:PAP2 superfamily
VVTVRKEDPEGLLPLRDQPTTGRWVASDGGPLRLYVRAMARIRRLRRPRWWEEILFIGISYALYSTVRNAVPGHSVAAFNRAHAILRFEQDLHIDAERPLNRLIAHSPFVCYLCSYWYALAHFIVTIGVLIWVYIRHPLRYRAIRTVAYTETLLALLGFWFIALAPPRMLSGFVDTVDKYPTVWGSWNTAGVAKLSNQLAAMPSLHIGWSTWAGLVIFKLAKHRSVRIAGLAYPVVTLFVILATANHFTLDAVGGLVVLGAGFAFQRLIFGRGAFDSPDQVRRAAPWRHSPETRAP